MKLSNFQLSLFFIFILFNLSESKEKRAGETYLKEINDIRHRIGRNSDAHEDDVLDVDPISYIDQDGEPQQYVIGQPIQHPTGQVEQSYDETSNMISFNNPQQTWPSNTNVHLNHIPVPNQHEGRPSLTALLHQQRHNAYLNQLRQNHGQIHFPDFGDEELFSGVPEGSEMIGHVDIGQVGGRRQAGRGGRVSVGGGGRVSVGGGGRRSVGEGGNREHGVHVLESSNFENPQQVNVISDDEETNPTEIRENED